MEKIIEGTCDNGYYCCQTVNDYCGTSACNTCGCKTVRDFIGYNTDNQPVYISFDSCAGRRSRCSDNCKVVGCNYRCFNWKNSHNCQTRCGQSYTYYYTFYHVPEKLEEFDPEAYNNVTRCEQESQNMNELQTCIDANYEYRGVDTEKCEIIDTNCAETEGYNANTTHINNS